MCSYLQSQTWRLQVLQSTATKAWYSLEQTKSRQIKSIKVKNKMNRDRVSSSFQLKVCQVNETYPFLQLYNPRDRMCQAISMYDCSARGVKKDSGGHINELVAYIFVIDFLFRLSRRIGDRFFIPKKFTQLSSI